MGGIFQMARQQFDLFKKEGDEVLWFGTADTLQDARMIIRERAGSAPGEYIVLDQKSGKKTTIDTTAG